MGRLKSTQRYIYSKNIIIENPNIKHVVGHSLGGAIGSHLISEYPHLTGRAYGAPAIFTFRNPRTEFYSHYGDPVAVTNVKVKQNYRFDVFKPESLFGIHSYKGFNKGYYVYK